MVGTFQYRTEAESGSLTFHVTVFKNGLEGGSGDGAGPILKGQRQTVMVSVTANPAVIM
jgi:hypothetical protein